MLTEAGEAFLVRAERLLAEAERARAVAGEFSGAVRGRVVIGALQSLVEIKLPSLLAAFNRRYPEVEIALREETTVQMLGMLKEGDLDLAFGHTTGVRLPPRIAAETLFEEGLLLVASREHVSVDRDEVSREELKDETFVCYKEGSGIRAVVLEACEDAGFEPRVSFECGTLRSLTAAGLGVAVVPRSMAECPGPPVAVADLVPSLTRTVAIFRVEGRYLSPPAEAFQEFAKERLAGDGRTKAR